MSDTIRVAGCGIISAGVLVNKIIVPAYPGHYGLHSATYDALMRQEASRPLPAACPDCIGYPCECGTAGEGC